MKIDYKCHNLTFVNLVSLNSSSKYDLQLKYCMIWMELYPKQNYEENKKFAFEQDSLILGSKAQAPNQFNQI